MLDHLGQLHRFYGADQGVKVARKHIGWYLAGRPGTELVRRELLRVENAADQLELVWRCFRTRTQRAA